MCDWLCTATVMTINISVCYYLLFMCVRVLHTNDLMNLPSRTALFTLFPFLFVLALLCCCVMFDDVMLHDLRQSLTTIKKEKKKKRDFWVDFGANKLQWATRQNANKTIKQFIKCRVSVSSEDIIRDCFFFFCFNSFYDCSMCTQFSSWINTLFFMVRWLILDTRMPWRNAVHR